MSAETCIHGHPRTPENTYRNPRGHRHCVPCQRQQARDKWRRDWDKKHAGHDITRDRIGRRYCLTCPARTWSVDETAVDRAVAGDPPERLTVAEREAAVLLLKQRGLPGATVAARVGCTDRTVWRILARQRDELGAAA